MTTARNRNTAIVLEIKERFFCGFGRGGRVKTAWSLAGARLFGAWREDEIKATEKKLLLKGKWPYRRRVFLEFEDQGR